MHDSEWKEKPLEVFKRIKTVLLMFWEINLP